jgi:hypothetical protein
METTKKSAAFPWLMTLVFTAITAYMIIFVPQWFWVPLPFMLTYLVQAFRAM